MARSVFHIAEREAWELQRASGVYRHPSLDAQGYIHCSNRDQMSRTLERFFAGRSGLVLLEIDVARLEPRLVDEEGEPGALYPHLYGPLNVNAVISVRDVGEATSGSWRPRPGPGGKG